MRAFLGDLVGLVVFVGRKVGFTVGLRVAIQFQSFEVSKARPPNAKNVNKAATRNSIGDRKIIRVLNYA